MSLTFISIAAYRDPELLPTLRNCLATAARPEDLRLCIAWQHAEEDRWDTLGEFAGDPRFTIIDIPYREAQGACWARHEIQRRYAGETYYLQLDSHHRFAPHWDATLQEWWHGLQAAGHERPILSAYLPPYAPKSDPEGRSALVYSMNIDRFLPEGVAFLAPQSVPGWAELPAPFPGRFLSAHFLFTLGRFAVDVPYDPHMYFHGEESSLSARAYTHGYEIFSPHRPVLWHEYERRGKSKHWDDDADWGKRNDRSYARWRRLFGMQPPAADDPATLAPYGLGTRRTLEDYERYAGIRFRTRQIHHETLAGSFPPIRTDLDAGLCDRIKICIDVAKDSLRESDYDLFAVALLDETGADLHRRDCHEDEIRALLQESPTDAFIHIWRTFQHHVHPRTSRVWPHSRSKGWMERIEQALPFV